jgi:hypothetical protein
MSDANQVRNRATRLLALALKARDNGLSEYADELTQLATEAFDHAADMERRSTRPNELGGNPSSTQWWNGVSRGTMDEVSSNVGLDLPIVTGKPRKRLFHLVLESHGGRAYVPIPERSTSPRVIPVP